MRIPRVTVRRMMALVAVGGVVIFILMEIGKGYPPQHVISEIPGRIAQLQPGMTKRQTYTILGLNKSWLLGGIGSKPGVSVTHHSRTYEAHLVRPRRFETVKHRSGMMKVDRSAGQITLRFYEDPSSGGELRLESASFASQGRSVARMP